MYVEKSEKTRIGGRTIYKLVWDIKGVSHKFEVEALNDNNAERKLRNKVSEAYKKSKERQYSDKPKQFMA